MVHFNPSARRRAGFTLVEMLVASALIIFMMYILASAFQSGLETFRQMKAAGDLQERLRGATTILRQDLTHAHFGDDGDRRALSDQRPDRSDWTPPAKGYVRIDQAGGIAVNEGIDPDDPTLTLQHGRMLTATNLPVLQFTVRLDGKRRDQFFTTFTNANINAYSRPDYTRGEYGATDPTFHSTWAEVAYFALPVGSSAGGTPLFALYRRVKMLVDTGESPTPPVPNSGSRVDPSDVNYIDLSFWRLYPAGQARFNSPKTVTAPMRRFGVRQTNQQPTPPNYVAAANVRGGHPIFNTSDTSLCGCKDAYPSADQAGGDLLLTNLVDFQIKVLWDPAVNSGSTIFAPADRTAPTPTANPDYPFDVLPAGVNTELSGRRVFDTWSKQDDSDGNGYYMYGKRRSGSSATPVPGSDPETPNNSGWNQGHFTNLVGQSATNESMPLRVRVRAIKLTLRIWDHKTEQTRQITVIQDL